MKTEGKKRWEMKNKIKLIGLVSLMVYQPL